MIYDPSTGICRWKERNINCKNDKTWNTRFSGKVIGSKDKKGYIVTKINGKTYRLHRLIWLYMTGEWPDNEIDHKNRIRHDNTWDNLRDVTTRINSLNKGIISTNKTGVVGVYFNKKMNKYVSQIKHMGKNYHIGCFNSLTKAELARVNKKKEMKID